MDLDIRIPIGYFFTIVGAILLGFGIWGDKSVYYRSLGINLNLWWGAVLLVFAGTMLGLAYRASQAKKNRDHK